jgi:hypothetical protein
MVLHLDQPIKFYLVFSDYMNFANENVDLSLEISRNDILEKLDKLRVLFPHDDFSELSSLYFEFDNTIRFILKSVPDTHKLEYIKSLVATFTKIYCEKVGIHYNPSIIIQMKYENELIEAKKKIRDMRNQLLLAYHTPSKENEKYVKQLMQDMFNNLI